MQTCISNLYTHLVCLWLLVQRQRKTNKQKTNKIIWIQLPQFTDDVNGHISPKETCIQIIDVIDSFYQVAELISFSGKFCLSAVNIELSLRCVMSIKRKEDVPYDEVKHDSACSELTSASTECDKDFDWLSLLKITSLIWSCFSFRDIR